MAKMTIHGFDEYDTKLFELINKSPDIVKKSIRAGAKVLADAIRKALNALPTENFRYLRNGEKYKGPTEQEKTDLLNAFGITPVSRGQSGDMNAKIGFDGYGSVPTKKYPQGVPNPLVARSIESGSTVRVKTPFVRPTVNRHTKAAQEAMAQACDEEIANIMD
ncbi:MAG TPA: hypothetical protein PKB13_08385 [Clostridia bacterium]|nr:hypothetical protein [Clostridia bacterium]